MEAFQEKLPKKKKAGNPPKKGIIGCVVGRRVELGVTRSVRVIIRIVELYFPADFSWQLRIWKPEAADKTRSARSTFPS